MADEKNQEMICFTKSQFRDLVHSIYRVSFYDTKDSGASKAVIKVILHPFISRESLELWANDAEKEWKEICIETCNRKPELSFNP